MHIFIVSNSPGELIGWVKPVINSLKKSSENIEIIAILPPCQYASGRESQILESFSEVKKVITPGQYLQYLLLRIKPSSFTSVKKGVVVFLGGDPFHALLISRRMRLPAVAYFDRPSRKRSFAKFMIKDPSLKSKLEEKGISPEKIVVVGDLVGDSLQVKGSSQEIKEIWKIRPLDKVVTFMPGSRNKEVIFMTPFFLSVAEAMKEEVPGIRFFLVLSPFVSREKLAQISEKKLRKVFSARPVNLQRDSLGWKVVSQSGTEATLIEADRYEIMSISDLVLTLPGTVTAELGFLGIPMIVVLPLNKPTLIPLEGILGLVGSFPWLGHLLKKWASKRYLEKFSFISLPNQILKKRVIPEITGVIEPKDVTQPAIRLLRNSSQRAEISHQLRKTFCSKGAADKAAQIIMKIGRRGK